MKLVILDRDGVINEDSNEFIKRPEEWIPIERSLDAIAHFTQAGWRVVVATNQSGLARKLFDMETLNRIHMKMHRLVEQAGGEIDAVFFCPHSPESSCKCRKPATGLLTDIAERFNIDLKGVPLVGDSLRDLEAIRAVGGVPMLVKTGKGEATLKAGGLPTNTLIFDDLYDAAEYLIYE